MAFQLALLRNTSELAEAYLADLPAKDAATPKITFSGPYNIASKKQAWSSSFAASDVIYDPSNQEIIWLVCGSKLKATVWHVGPHFGLQAVDSTPLGCEQWTPATAVLHGNLLTVSSTKILIDEGPPGSTFECAMAQRGREGPWTSIPFTSGFTNDFGLSDILFRSTHESVHYVYHLRMRKTNNEDILVVDQIRDSKFQSLTTDKSGQWSSYEVRMPYVPERCIPLVTTDSSSGKHKMYFFQLSVGPKAIETASIPLRPDGSVDCTQHKLKATPGSPISVVLNGRIQGFKVVDLRGEMVLLAWEEMQGTTAPKPVGKLGVVVSDGSMPQGTAWKDVLFEFSTPITDNVTQSHFSAVLVPKTFAP